MSGISTGIGLISGIDTASLIDQLIAIERRPIDNLEARVGELDVERTAFVELSAQLLAVQAAIGGFSQSNFFDQFSANSTDDSVATATASASAAPGSFTFRVRSLVTNHALISRGFANSDKTPVGVGTLSIEVGEGKVNRSTLLNSLNGGDGVTRGVIKITDRSGGSAEIDLTTAVTVDDVLRAINTNSSIAVRASVTSLASNGAVGDRLVVEDQSGGAGNLIVEDFGAGSIAGDLGIAVNAAASRIDGIDLVRLNPTTQLSVLNDGLGIGRAAAGPDISFTSDLGNFDVSLSGNLAAQLDTDLRALNSGNGVRLGIIRITDRAGTTVDVDLTAARTVRDVITAISESGAEVSATVVGIGTRSIFIVTDESGFVEPPVPDGVDPEDLPPLPRLKFEDVTGSTAADLGLAQDVEENSIQGSAVYRVETIGDVVNAINFAQGNGRVVEASISADGNSIDLRTFSVGSVTVNAVEGSTAAVDLGIADATITADLPFHSRQLIAGLNTVLLQSLRGGAGIDAGTVSFTDRVGNTSEIDFSTAQTLKEIVDLINADGATELVASVNNAGSGITLRDESLGGLGAIVISDVSGTLAAQLGIAIADDPTNPFAGNVVSGVNAQLQYVTARTLLADLGAGRGVSTGTFQITGSNGAVVSVTIDDGLTTVGQVLARINGAASETIEARINDTGDGIIVVDTAGGDGKLTIEDRDGGRAAADLRLVGTASASESSIDGSFETKIQINAADTLDDISRKISEAGAGFSAAVLDHGGDTNPFGLTITSDVTGRRGELTIDTGGLDLGLSTLAEAQDAVVTVGEAGASNPLLVTASSNTLEGIAEGISVDLLAASDDFVTVTVAQDVDTIVDAIQRFADTYNGALDSIDRSTSFDQDTLERGALLGDSTVNLVRDRLNRAILRPFDNVDPSITRLFSIGLRLGTGGRLEFDENKFREVYEESPDAVERLFNQPDTGFAAVLKDTFERLTNDFDGVITRRDQLLGDQQELLNDRIDGLGVLLEAKRARLQAQFVGLESALAALQDQQNSLSTLAQLAR